MANKAIVVVDVQNDFLPKGALGVETAQEIVPLINRLVKLPFDVKVATQDWHPQGHCSFASTWAKKAGESILIEEVQQTLWPDHCIQGTRGAEFSPQLDVSHFDQIVHKGVDPKVDSYSTFFDNMRLRTTGLESYLRSRGVRELYFAGLTTEYCVFYSVLDALELGFSPYVIIDACRGIDLRPGDVEHAIRTMIERGAKLVTTEEVEKKIR